MTEEKCKQYIKSDGLNFCMSSVCLEKDCIYALVNKLHQTIDRLEQENKELKKQHYEVLKMLKNEYKGRQRDNEQWFTRCTENHNEDIKIIDKYRSALEEINITVKQLLQGISSNCINNTPYLTALSLIENKINEVLNV